MRGITEESLRHVMKMHDMNDSKTSLIFSHLFNECAELNEWQPIETAPHDRPILAMVDFDYGIEIETVYHEIQWIGKRWSCHPNIPTHWQELPKDPK